MNSKPFWPDVLRINQAPVHGSLYRSAMEPERAAIHDHWVRFADELLLSHRLRPGVREQLSPNEIAFEWFQLVDKLRLDHWWRRMTHASMMWDWRLLNGSPLEEPWEEDIPVPWRLLYTAVD